jgi:hypothetical protein
MNRSSGGNDKRNGQPAGGFGGDAAEAGRGVGFGRRKERPDANLTPVINTGAAANNVRVPRSVSPPLD